MAKILVTRYNDRCYHSVRKSYRTCIDLSRVVMIDKLDEGKDCFKIYIGDNMHTIYVSCDDFDNVYKLWLHNKND